MYGGGGGGGGGGGAGPPIQQFDYNHGSGMGNWHDSGGNYRTPLFTSLRKKI